MSMKNPLTPAEIEPATYRFVAQHLNHYATTVPAIPIVLHTIINIGRVSETQLMNILLLRSYIYTIAYLKSMSNYMFRPFFVGHHQVERTSCLRELYNMRY